MFYHFSRERVEKKSETLLRAIWNGETLNPLLAGDWQQQTGQQRGYLSKPYWKPWTVLFAMTDCNNDNDRSVQKQCTAHAEFSHWHS